MDTLRSIPHEALGAIIMIVPAVIVWFLYRGFVVRLVPLVRRYGSFPEKLIAGAEGPASAIVVILALGITLPAAGFSVAVAIAIAQLLLIALILAAGWTVVRAIEIGADLYLRHLHLAEDTLRARKQATEIHILRRSAQTLVVIVTVGTALMTVSTVRQFGISLFASAGAAGIIVGFAARPVLSNLIAGIQIALTQPIRVEDAVVVEGEWGWIDNITSTYVVVRTWDLRRLIVPLSYFIEKPFQNWTFEGSELIGSVILHVDYRVPVERLRRKLEELVRRSDRWDGRVVSLQVTDTPAGMVELRALASARNAADAWDLRCEIRENLIAFLQKDYPDALPRQRVETTAAPEPKEAPRPRRPARRVALRQPAK